MQRNPNDLLRCPHHSPHIPPVRDFAAATLHGDAAGQDARYGAPVECSEDGRGQEGSPHPSQEVQTLLFFLDLCHSVHRPGPLFINLAYAQKKACALSTQTVGFIKRELDGKMCGPPRQL